MHIANAGAGLRRLTPTEVRAIDWLPPSCAYRRLAEGKDLAVAASAGFR